MTLTNRKMTSITFEPDNLLKLRELAKNRGMSLGAFLETTVLQEDVSPFDADTFPPEHFSKRNSAIFMLANMKTPSFTAPELAEMFGLSEPMINLIKHGKGQKTGADTEDSEEDAEAPFVEGITAPLSVTIPVEVYSKIGLSTAIEKEYLTLVRMKLHEAGFSSVSYVGFDVTPKVKISLRGKDAISGRESERIKSAVEWALNQAEVEFSQNFQKEGAE